MIFESLIVLTAIALALSIRLSQVMTITVSLGIFLAGVVSNSLSGWVNHQLALPADLGVYTSFAAIFTADIGLGFKLACFAAKTLYLILPNLQFFWPGDAISQNHSMVYDLSGKFTLTPLLSVTFYGLLYTVVVLCIAIALFQRREVG